MTSPSPTPSYTERPVTESDYFWTGWDLFWVAVVAAVLFVVIGTWLYRASMNEQPQD